MLLSPLKVMSHPSSSCFFSALDLFCFPHFLSLYPSKSSKYCSQRPTFIKHCGFQGDVKSMQQLIPDRLGSSPALGYGLDSSLWSIIVLQSVDNKRIVCIGIGCLSQCRKHTQGSKNTSSVPFFLSPLRKCPYFSNKAKTLNNFFFPGKFHELYHFILKYLSYST